MTKITCDKCKKDVDYIAGCFRDDKIEVCQKCLDAWCKIAWDAKAKAEKDAYQKWKPMSKEQQKIMDRFERVKDDILTPLKRGPLVCLVHGRTLGHSRFAIGYDSATGEAIRPIVCRRCEVQHCAVWIAIGIGFAGSVASLVKVFL